MSREVKSVPQSYGARNTHSNGKAIENSQQELQPTFRRVTEDDIAFLLQTLTRRIGRKQPILTVKKIEDICGVSESTVYHWTQTGKIPGVYLIAIVHEAARRGEFAGLESFNPSNYMLAPLNHGALNASLDDEIALQVEYLGQARQAFERGDKDEALKCANAAKETLATLEAEIKALKK